MLPFLRGSAAVLLLLLDTLFWCVPFYSALAFRVLMPERRLFRDLLARFAEGWIEGAALALRVTGIVWDVQGVPKLRHGGWYLLVGNHRSTADALVLLRAFRGNGPLLKFFPKRSLLWTPFIGPAMWGLDYPFLKRHSRETLARHPEKRGEDLVRTRRAVSRFREAPGLACIFPEGTCYTPARHRAQGSPYRHLLRPKAGGTATALGLLGDRLDGLLDATIVYPDPRIGLRRFLSGRAGRVVLRVREVPVPEGAREGDYEGDPAFRRRFQEWLDALWSEKDARIDALKTAAGGG